MMKLNPNVTNDKDKQLGYWYFIIASSEFNISRKPYARVFHHLLQETSCKKASMSQIMHLSNGLKRNAFDFLGSNILS
jgi:FMN phosphatase YigB (HAD superfamily)